MDFDFPSGTITDVAIFDLGALAGPFQFNGTGGILLPIGTTAERPSLISGQAGIRYNTTISKHELFDSATTTWLNVASETYVTNQIGTSIQPQSALLTAVAALPGNGIVVQTGAATVANRTLTGTTNQITLTNGDGVSGNPTVSLPTTLIAPGSLAVTSYIDLPEISTPANPAADTARLYANDEKGFSALRYRDTGGVELTLARDNVFVARNNTGSTITRGSAVYISGAASNAPTVTLARADAESTMPAVGLTYEDIPNSSFGRVIVLGDIININTSAFSAGDRLYVSQTTAGALTSTPPAHPNIRQAVAVVLVSGVGNGVLGVNSSAPRRISDGTVSNTFYIGDGTAGAKTLAFYANFQGNLNWTPTAARNITVPDASGTLALTSDLSGYQPLDSDLTALANTATTGLYTVTGSGTSATRTLTAGSSKISITNGSGVAGNPTIDAVEANFTLDNIGGTLGVSKGGTGNTGTPTNGQLLIGNGTGFTLASLTAGANITITPGAGSITIAASGGSGSPGGANTQVQYNDGGVFGGDAAFTFVEGANPYVAITGTTAQNNLRVGGATQVSTATAYIETNTSGNDGLRCYFNSGSAATSAYINYSYDGASPYIRIVDGDDDPAYILFNTIGSGSLAAPQFVNRFGGRGPVAGATTGFAWQVNGSEIATLDSQWLELPDGTTAQRPTGVNGMIRYNTSFLREEAFEPGGWVRRIGIIDKTTTNAVITTAGPNNTYSFTVPGGTLGTDGILRLTLAGLWANASGVGRTVTVAISYGGTTMWSDTSATLATGADLGWNMVFYLCANNATNSQTLNGMIMLGSTGAVGTGVAGDLSSDEITGNAQIVGNNAAADSTADQTLAVSVTFSGGTITWTKYFHILEKL